MNLSLKKDRMGRRVAMMLAGIVLLAIGIGLFKISRMGNDPSSSLVIAIGDQIGVDFSIVLIVANCLWFISEVIFARQLIGIGTFVNWFGIGPIASLFEKAITAQFGTPGSWPVQALIMAAAVLVLGLGCALYQTADLGIAPYDALSIVPAEKTKIKYFWCRIAVDSLCVFIAFILGGLIGLGTLVSALGMGPFIAFFTRHVAMKMLYGKEGKA